MNLLAERISLQTQNNLNSANQLPASMLMFGKSIKELSPTTVKDTEKCLDSQLWHACAGGMVQMPSMNAKVYYFPQGHAEHAQAPVDFGKSIKIPAFILSRVTGVKYMADPNTDEVFAKIRLVPVRQNEVDFGQDDGIGLGCNGSPELQEKPASFAKTLTQSDANNGGGFSVPRYCAETIFPRLDYSANPPVQTVLVKDVHGEIWKFRHIYRGTPRRHLLTTGWSTFVNQKKLVAGDSIVFMRIENGDLCVGIRRAKRGIGGGPNQPTGWHPPMSAAYGGFSVFLREEETRSMRVNGTGGLGTGSNMSRKSRVSAESVIKAAKLAASGQPFEVVYYPRASTPEFCVKAAAVRAAMTVQWFPGMRFKMAFETEDSSRISWFMGTISSVQAADPIWWPTSPWRLLEVTWDEPDLLQDVKRVNPWLVELVSNMPAIHLSPYSPPRKKLRVPPHPDFPLDTPRLPLPPFLTPHGPIGSSSCCLPQYGTPAGIQGARHAQYGLSLSDLHPSKLQSGLLRSGFHHGLDLTTFSSTSKFPTDLFVGNPAVDNDISCLLTIGNPSTNKSCNEKKSSQLVLFGKPIFTEQQISLSSSGNSSSDENNEKTTKLSSSDGSASWSHRQNGDNSPSWFKDHQTIDLGLETGHYNVFLEFEDVSCSLDLSDFRSYEELYEKLADILGIEKSEIVDHLLYHDADGSMKRTGDAPFIEFMKTARKLMMLMDSGSDNLGS